MADSLLQLHAASLGSRLVSSTWLLNAQFSDGTKLHWGILILLFYLFMWQLLIDTKIHRSETSVVKERPLTRIVS